MASQGWAMSPKDVRKYALEFNAMDMNKSGYISGKVFCMSIRSWNDCWYLCAGSEAKTLLTKSGLDQMVLAKIW